MGLRQANYDQNLVVCTRLTERKHYTRFEKRILLNTNEAPSLRVCQTHEIIIKTLVSVPTSTITVIYRLLRVVQTSNTTYANIKTLSVDS